jgi:cytochrome P450
MCRSFYLFHISTFVIYDIIIKEDMEFAGQHIKRGDVIFPILLSANYDESQFTAPEELDIARTLSRHLAFGHGIHSCLGAPLARLEGDIALPPCSSACPTCTSPSPERVLPGTLL